MTRTTHLYVSQRVNRRVKDAVGILSADVVFCTASAGTTPTASSAWQTAFDKLTKTAGLYVWSATKTMLTDGTVTYTGIYKLGKVEELMDVQEQYALSDSKATAPTSGWSTAYTPTAGKYLWTRNVYTWNGGSAITSTAQCVGYFAKDGTNGTSFVPRGVAVAHCANYAAANACDKTEGDIIIVDSASAFPASKCSSGSVIKAAPSVAQFINAPDYTWNVQPADTGDAYRVGTSLWVNNGSAWVDFGDIQGPQGEAGEDALNVVVSNTTVAFTWSRGHPFDGDFQTVTLKVMKGTAYLTPGTDYTVEATAYTNYQSGMVNGIKSGDGYLIYIYGQLIATNTFTKQSIVDKTKTETYEYPMSTAAVVLTVKETATGKTANVTINITVDMKLLYGGLEWTQANLASTYGELTTVGNRVTTCESSIVQNAKSITSHVSALREATHTNLFGFNKGVAFEGEGTKLFYIQAYGVCYTGGSWYRIRNLGFNGTGGDFTMRCKVYSSAAVTITFDICDTNANEGSVYIPAGTWTTVTRTFSNVSGYCNADGYNGFFDTQVNNTAAQITIADLSIERGTVAPTECTICAEDAQAFGKDYRNIEWDALYPTQKQTETVNGGSADAYYGYVGSTAAGVYEDILYKNGMTAAGDSKVYTLSFWARADQQGMCITSYLYGNSNNPSGGMNYEKSLSGGGSQTVQNVTDGATNTYVTTEWKKYYVHWRTINGSNFNVIPFRIVGNLNANHSGGRIFMAGAVFEEGYICDDNYASASSFSKIQQTADSIELKVKETGIDIENKKVILTADNLSVKSNDGSNQLYAEDGNLVVSGTVTATNGKIGNWYIYNNMISSHNNDSEDNYIELDAQNKTLIVRTGYFSDNDSHYSDLDTEAATVTISAGSGRVEARGLSSNGVSYISSRGICSTTAQIYPRNPLQGWRHCAAVVGLGAHADVDATSTDPNLDMSCVAGVYGLASNSGTACSYGGYFWQLKARGFVRHTYCYYANSGDTIQLSLDASYVVMLHGSGWKTVYLPQGAAPGQEVLIVTESGGGVHVQTSDGSIIGYARENNGSIDYTGGVTGIFRLCRYYENNVLTWKWIASTISHV